MTNRARIICSVILMFICFAAFAQNNEAPTKQVVYDREPLSDLVVGLSSGVLVFGFLTICLEVYLVRIKVFDADDMIKFITVTMIVTGTMFLITAGYSNNQIAPAIGLFGTIAGYLVGKAKNPERKKKTDDINDEKKLSNETP